MMEFLAALEQTQFSTWVRESNSLLAFPTVLVLHTIGMAIVAGGSAMLCLMILGCWPKAPLKPLERIFPAIWWGFGLNALTGTILLMQDATAKLLNPDFYVKMLLIALGVVVLKTMRRKVFGSPELD